MKEYKAEMKVYYSRNVSFNVIANNVKEAKEKSIKIAERKYKSYNKTTKLLNAECLKITDDGELQAQAVGR